MCASGGGPLGRGPPKHTQLFFGGGCTMTDRILSLLLCLSIMFSVFAGSAPRAKAVAPLGLGAAVVFSFLWSAGIELWRDGADGDMTPQESMESAISGLWDDYRLDGNLSAPNLDVVGNNVTFDQFGRAIIVNQLAYQLQDFLDWFKEKYLVKPGEVISLTEESSPGDSYLFTMPQSEVESLSGYNTVWALPIGAMLAKKIEIWNNDLHRGSVLDVSESIGNVYMFQISSKPGEIYICSSQPFKRATAYLNSDREQGEFSYTDAVVQSLRNVSRPNDGNNFVFYEASSSYSVSRYDITFSPVPPMNTFNYSGSSSETRLQIEYIILRGDFVGSSSDIFANIGLTVLDNLYDTLENQSIAIDIGQTGAETDKEEGFLVSAADAFVAGEDAALGFSAVATPVPVEGVSELYPTADSLITDVEELGTPSLGQALSTRFPFCIPFDVNYLFKSLSASPKRPIFEIDVIPQSLKTRIGITQDTGFTLDFGDQKYSLLLKIIRWGCLFGFIMWLALITKRLIWTTGG